MRVLLTGATGFVGSYVLQELLSRGIEVAILLRPDSNPWRISAELNNCTIIEGGLADTHQIENSVKQFLPDALIHLAWEGVENQHRNSDKQLQDNFIYSQRLFELCISAKVRTIIGTGSQAEYGPANCPLSEDAPTNPTTLYGISKLATCHLLRVLCEQQGVRHVWHRIFSSFGPKDNTTWFIPMLINKLMRGESPALTEGTQLWDYVYVEDVARAIVVSLLESNCQGIFNIGSGKSCTIRDIAIKLRDSLNPSLQLGFGQVPFRPDQVMFLQADISRLKNILNWQPQVSLQEGLQKTINWMQLIGNY